MRVGIFGGTFNPPHFAHLILAEVIREQAQLDLVRWIPTHTPPHKASQTSPDHRLAMTRLAIAGNNTFEVSDIELQRGGASYTVDTVKALQESEPETSFFLLIGGDSLKDFMTWRHPEEIVRRVPLIVYRRRLGLPDAGDDSEAANRFADSIQYADAPAIDLSSAAIRERVRHGLSIRYLVPDPVRTYIDRHGLYR